MANNSAEHRTAEEIYHECVGWYPEDGAIEAMQEFATQQVKAKDDELARVTKLLEKLYRHHGSWIKTELVDKAWNDYKTKNEIR